MVDAKHYLVTGGSGFIGSALVHRLVHEGHRVRVLDNNSRGSTERLADVSDEIEFVQADIRDVEAVSRTMEGIDSVCHLAFINGTRFFYDWPELVLDVGVKGIVNVIDGCLAHNVPDLVVASSSEVYQTPPVVPTDETVPLTIPDAQNPRYSYAAGKIISEIMAINYGRKHFERVVIFRPHNVYGPDMGWEHVIPQFVLRMKSLCAKSHGTIRFPIQGTGRETRAFVFVDDFIDGLNILLERGEHLGIYNIGTKEEVTIGIVAGLVAEYYGREVELLPGELACGGTVRRCPDISKLTALGYWPQFPLRKGVSIAAQWYDHNAHKAPEQTVNPD